MEREAGGGAWWREGGVQTGGAGGGTERSEEVTQVTATPPNVNHGKKQEDSRAKVHAGNESHQVHTLSAGSY